MGKSTWLGEIIVEVFYVLRNYYRGSILRHTSIFFFLHKLNFRTLSALALRTRKDPRVILIPFEDQQ